MKKIGRCQIGIQMACEIISFPFMVNLDFKRILDGGTMTTKDMLLVLLCFIVCLSLPLTCTMAIQWSYVLCVTLFSYNVYTFLEKRKLRRGMYPPLVPPHPHKHHPQVHSFKSFVSILSLPLFYISFSL